MKKKITAIFLCVALLAIAIVGASLAYFTDTKSATNTFTVGNVKIELIESKYHREGNDNSGDKTIPDPTHTVTADDGMKYVETGHTMFTNDEIKRDAETYKDEYLAVKGKNMVPGRCVAKCPYVVNTGANDAFIRIRVMVPSAVNNDFDQNVQNGGIITNQWCSSSISTGEFIDGKGGGWNNAPAIERNVEKDGVEYDVYTFTRKEPLKAGAMTEWNVWNFIGISEKATDTDIQKAVEAGAITTGTDGTLTLNVLVEADAIQAEGFANAAAAWAAFN